MLETLYYLLVFASLLILIFRRKKLDKRVQIFIPLLLLSLAVEGARFTLTNDHPIPKFLFSIYTPIEYFLLSLFAISILNSNLIKKMIWGTIPVFVVLSLFVQFKMESSNYFYKYLDVLIEAPLVLTWTLLYVFQLFSDEKTFHFKSNPVFWISMGNLLFFSGSFFSYGFGSYLHNAGQYNLSEAIFWIERVLNIFLYIIYVIGFLCSNQKKLFS